MPIPSKSELYKIQRSYVIPVKNDYWTMHQTAILSVLSSCEPLHICGDGRSDSPGFSVKYTSYTIMDMTSPVTEGVPWKNWVCQHTLFLLETTAVRSLLFIQRKAAKMCIGN